MSTAVRYERVNTGIVDFNLSQAEEPVAGSRGGESHSGFMTECYLGPSAGTRSGLANGLHTHYREYR